MNSKYDFAPHLENPEETEEMDQNTFTRNLLSPKVNLLVLMHVMTVAPLHKQMKQDRRIKMLLKQRGRTLFGSNHSKLTKNKFKMSEKCNGNNLKTENIEKFYFYHKKHKIWGVEDKTFFKV